MVTYVLDASDNSGDDEAHAALDLRDSTGFAWGILSKYFQRLALRSLFLKTAH